MGYASPPESVCVRVGRSRVFILLSVDSIVCVVCVRVILPAVCKLPLRRVCLSRQVPVSVSGLCGRVRRLACVLNKYCILCRVSSLPVASGSGSGEMSRCVRPPRARPAHPTVWPSSLLPSSCEDFYFIFIIHLFLFTVYLYYLLIF